MTTGSAILRAGSLPLEAASAMTGSPASDEDLARRARAGSREAFAQLVRRYERPLARFLWVRTARQEDAEELVQETFLRAWSQLERYDPTRRFATWLFTVARRLAISRRRRERGGALGEEALAQCASAEPDPEASASREEESLELWSLATRVLRAEERSALWLRYGEDLSTAEIAAVLGRRQVSVRVLLFRAREKLAGHLAHARPAGDDRDPRENARERGEGR